MPNVQTKAARATDEPANQHNVRYARSLLKRGLGHYSTTLPLGLGVRGIIVVCHLLVSQVRYAADYPTEKEQSMALFFDFIAREMRGKLSGDK